MIPLQFHLARAVRRLFASLVGLLLGAAGALADTTLFDNGVWRVTAATDPAANATAIAISVGGVPAGNFSAINIAHVFTGAGFPQFFSVKGRGAIQVVMPPPGVAGGTFYLTRYWDCAAGLTADLQIFALDLPANAGGSLTITGHAGNLSSLEAAKFRLRFYEPDDDLVRVEVSYKLSATRDLCVDQSRQDVSEGFQVARIASNYLSAEEHASNYLNYFAVLDEYCDWFGCVEFIGGVCAQLRNENRALVCFADRLADPHLVLAHTGPTPRNTPTLAVHFRSPSPKRLVPQGASALAADPAAENVELWGNWPKAKPSYLAGQKIGSFRFYLEVFRPGAVWCDAGACY